jgi:hypothetical protein
MVPLTLLERVTIGLHTTPAIVHQTDAGEIVGFLNFEVDSYFLGTDFGFVLDGPETGSWARPDPLQVIG